MKFEEKLIKLRKEKAMSQEELGEKLNVTRQTISKWELGQTKPDAEKLAEISKLFNVSTDKLLNDEEDISKTKNKVTMATNDNNKKNIIIVIIFAVVLVVLLAGIVFSFFSNILKMGNAEGLLNTFFNMVDKGNEKFNENYENIVDKSNEKFENMIDKINEKMVDNSNESKEEFKSTFNEMSDEMNKQFNEYSAESQKSFWNTVDSQTESNKKYKIKSSNSTYENLYTGVKDKFFTEEAIKCVIADNLKNERKITVKYNNLIAKESDELVNLKSKLNNKEYIISYDYDEEGYICQMNIKDI